MTIKHIGSRGEGISQLSTEVNYKVNNYTFFIPYTLPDEIVLVKPTLVTSEGIRANLVEIKSGSPKELILNVNIFSMWWMFNATLEF